MILKNTNDDSFSTFLSEDWLIFYSTINLRRTKLYFSKKMLLKINSTGILMTDVL